MLKLPTLFVLRKGIPALLLVVFGLALSSGAASAHPLGNFTVNRYSKLDVASRHLAILYIVDMAEIPTHAERAAMDTDGDGAISTSELDHYRIALAAELTQHLALTVGGQRTALAVEGSAITFPAGQAGLPTLRIEMHLMADLPAAQPLQVEYTDGNYTDRIGWKEIIATPQPGAQLANATVGAEDISHALTAYPQDLLSSPLQVTTASFTIMTAPAVAGASATAASAAGNVPVATQVKTDGRPRDPFTDLIAIPELGFNAIFLALLAAIGWGAVHALSPGHGKTIVAAYLVGSRGTVRHALFLGLTTTLTHTAGVFAVGLVALTLTRFILPEQLYPWLSTISGLLVVLIGISLIRQRLHPDSSAHTHSHAPGQIHAHIGVVRPHSHAESQDGATSGTDLTVYTPERALTWRSLLALGISGGLLPCPSALVLMLGAISLHRVSFGLVLILAFSLGLAGVLTLVGILLVHAGKLFERFPESGRIAQFAPVASAVFIVGAGLVITAQALAQTGLLPI